MEDLAHLVLKRLGRDGDNRRQLRAGDVPNSVENAKAGVAG